MAIPVHDNQEDPTFTQFFEGERQLPSFTMALRGYHKEEVDEYLRELREAEAEDTSTRLRLEAEVDRLHGRVAALERCLNEQTPHTIGALGERVMLILRQAEDGAAQALADANSQAELLRREAAERAESFVRQASLRATQAAQQLAAARAEAAQLREREEAEAHQRAAEIVARAQEQAAAIVAGARSQADEVAQQARVDETRAREEIFQLRSHFDAEMEQLAERRRRVLSSLAEVHATLAETLSSAGEGQPETPSEPPTREQPAVDVSQEDAED